MAGTGQQKRKGGEGQPRPELHCQVTRPGAHVDTRGRAPREGAGGKKGGLRRVNPFRGKSTGFLERGTRTPVVSPSTPPS